MKVLSDILLAIDVGDMSALVLLDLFTAFDTADHGILLERLDSSYEVVGTVLYSGYNPTCQVGFSIFESAPLLLQIPWHVAFLSVPSFQFWINLCFLKWPKWMSPQGPPRVHISKRWDEEMIVGIDKFLVVGGSRHQCNVCWLFQNRGPRPPGKLDCQLLTVWTVLGAILFLLYCGDLQLIIESHGLCHVHIFVHIFPPTTLKSMVLVDHQPFPNYWHASQRALMKSPGGCARTIYSWTSRR